MLRDENFIKNRKTQIQPFVNSICAAIDRVVCGRFARNTKDTLQVRLIDLIFVY